MLGETHRTLHTVRDPAHPSHATKIFDTRFTSDSLGRLLRTGYPDGEQVTHTYDVGGSLAKVSGAAPSASITPGRAVAQFLIGTSNWHH